jgi:hypothetical protein
MRGRGAPTLAGADASWAHAGATQASSSAANAPDDEQVFMTLQNTSTARNAG